MKTEKTQHVIFTNGLPEIVTGIVPERPTKFDSPSFRDERIFNRAVQSYEAYISTLERIPVAKEFHHEVLMQVKSNVEDYRNEWKPENNKLYRLSESLEYSAKSEHRFIDGPDSSWHPGTLTNISVGVKFVYEERKVAILIDSKEPEKPDETPNTIADMMSIQDAILGNPKEVLLNGVKFKRVERPKESEEELWEDAIDIIERCEPGYRKELKTKFTITRR
jgi:hypothetical protein